MYANQLMARSAHVRCLVGHTNKACLDSAGSNQSDRLADDALPETSLSERSLSQMSDSELSLAAFALTSARLSKAAAMPEELGAGSATAIAAPTGSSAAFATDAEEEAAPVKSYMSAGRAGTIDS